VEAIAAALAVLAGASLQSATGFGFAMLASPLLFALIGPQEAVAAGSIVSTLVNVVTLGGERRRPAPLPADVTVICLCSIPGLALGAVALRVLPTQVLSLVVAAGVVAGLTVRVRAARRARTDRIAPAWSAPAAGLSSGVLSTSTGISGPPIILHLLGRGVAPGRLRDTFAVIFLVQGVLGIATLALAGTLRVPGSLGLLIVAALAGQVLGRSLFARMDAARYERVVLVVLAGTALVAVVSAFV
jgi:uncharacterized membrane protein YfcA